MKTVVKKCVECGQHSAIHFGKHLCYDCMTKLLSEKVREEDK